MCAFYDDVQMGGILYYFRVMKSDYPNDRIEGEIMDGNNQYNNNPDQYGQDGQYSQNNQYGQNGQYTSNNQYSGQYSQNDQYNQNQNGQYSNYQDYTANIPYQVPPGSAADNATNGLQIAGLVCGILAICSSCCYGVPGLILGIAGLTCAIMGNRQSKNGVGTAGLVCSIVGLIFGIIMSAFWGMIIGEIIAEMMDEMMYY